MSTSLGVLSHAITLQHVQDARTYSAHRSLFPTASPFWWKYYQTKKSFLRRSHQPFWLHTVIEIRVGHKIRLEQVHSRHLRWAMPLSEKYKIGLRHNLLIFSKGVGYHSEQTSKGNRFRFSASTNFIHNIRRGGGGGAPRDCLCGPTPLRAARAASWTDTVGGWHISDLTLSEAETVCILQLALSWTKTLSWNIVNLALQKVFW